MDTKYRCFPYDKSTVLNALYDTIEALGLRLDSSNSIRGTLIVSDTGHTGTMRVALNPDGGTGHTLVDIFPGDPGDTSASLINTWRLVLLDELSGTLRRALQVEEINNGGF